MDELAVYQGRNTTDGETATRGRDGSRHRHSFFLHLRPASYPADAVAFANTLHLGYLSVFFLALEWLTGVLLMFYYVPSPDGAYESIIRLMTEVPFGMLVRDLHRLGGECMIVAAVLHMVRVYIAGAHNGLRGPTWTVGIVMLVCTLALAFSGYLLPWDQLAYWAVTIGTGIAETTPFIGSDMTLLLRGGPEFGADGLLRFYLLHIILLPAALAAGLGVHYYRIARLHGLSRPVQGKTTATGNRLRFFPDIALRELTLGLFALLALLVVCTVFYDAPLEHHADPRHTPARTTAPWFFLWLQGGLKLGDSFLMGICFPIALLLLLLFLPSIDRGKRKPLFSRPVAGPASLALLVAITVLSIVGLPRYGIETGPVTAVLETLIPEEGIGRFHAIGFDDLRQGIYETGQEHGGLGEKLSLVLDEFSHEVRQLGASGDTTDPKGVVIIQHWQANLKKVTIRIHWLEKEAGDEIHKSAEAVTYVHRGRTAQSHREAGGE